MRKILPLLFIALFLSENMNAQAGTDLAIGQWKQHLPFVRGVYVAQSDDQVFYATSHALLIFDKADRAFEMVTKVERLSGVGVNLVKYNKGSDVLLLGYEDGVIDLLSDEGNLTLLNVPESNILLGEKRLNDVFMANDSVAFIAGNFGLTTLNVLNGRFPNTIKMPFEAKGVVVWNERIFAATVDGIYFVDPSEVFNIDDFSSWSRLEAAEGFPFDYSSNALAVFNDKLYADVNDSLLVFDGNSTELLRHFDDFSIQYLTSEGEHLIAGWQCGEGNCNGQVLIFDENHNARPAGNSCVNRPTYAIEDEEGNIWYADRWNSYRIQDLGRNTCPNLTLNSPASKNTYDIAIDNGQVWVATGGLNLTFSALFRQDGLFSLVDGQWTQYYLWNTPELKDVSDFLDVEFDPVTGNVWAGAFLDALVEYDQEEGTFTIFNETNSDLQIAPADPNRSRAAGLAFDADDNLWVCNTGAPEPIVVFRQDGTSQSFGLDCSTRTGIVEIVVDALGYKWLMNIDGGFGITVFDEGEMDVAGDDECFVVNTSNSVLPTNEVNVMKVDRDGAVWVGTNLGAVVFQCDPFNGGCTGTRPFVEVDGFGANLLEDQNVQAIGIDGANRKWFGTAAGIFIMSPEGNEQIAHLTAENSPLFSNDITAIEFDNENGIAYIGTTEGLISLRTEATSAEGFHSNVMVFPNPVRPEYEGPIAIKGLAEDATVKITDVSGQLVYETEALGGQAIWNGRDYNDRKVNTGVYLVFATSQNSNDPQVAVTKILVVN